MNPVDLVMARAIVSSTDRPTWLAARARGVTATEVAKLAKNGPAYQRELIAAKLAGGMGPDLNGIPTVANGNIREDVIAEWIEKRFSIRPNRMLLHSVESKRHLATPDGVGANFDDEIVISEIKTSGHDLNPAYFGYFHETTYLDQMQWGMHVTGARRCLFVWEQHNNDFTGWPHIGPLRLHDEPQFSWVERDEAAIVKLHRIAEAFLSSLDEVVKTGGAQVDIPDPDVVGLLAADLLEARKREAVAKSGREAIWRGFLKSMEGRSSFSTRLPHAQISWVPAMPDEEPDPDAAAEADPELFARYNTTQEEWKSHLKKFTRPTLKAARLTVTEPK